MSQEHEGREADEDPEMMTHLERWVKMVGWETAWENNRAGVIAMAKRYWGKPAYWVCSEGAAQGDTEP